METIYRLKANELNMAFCNSVKDLFADQEIELKIKPVETNIDEITILVEKTLAEEWNSKEDDRWDVLYSK